MAYNYNFYNNIPGSAYTFRGSFPQYLPMPIPPPPPITPFSLTPELTDQEILKKFECHIPLAPKPKLNNVTITEMKVELINLLRVFNETKEDLQKVSENVDNISDQEWKCSIQGIYIKKDIISKKIKELSESYVDLCRKYVAKRTSKRMRLKKKGEEQVRRKREKKKQLEEKSRKIDENLQKIKDENQRIQQEKETMLNTDIVLKDVLRKKHDAKKFISKLDALSTLYEARRNTAKGRGQSVSDNDVVTFQNKIEKLKLLWMQKLDGYEKEENDLRAQLKESAEPHIKQVDKDIGGALLSWKQALFGGENPQVDFNGDVGRFVAVRREWDQYLHDEGTALPVGWVLPHTTHS